ncbi:MAG: ABC transporter ATP-binding protein, partial [Eubacteriales bacterium]|nr:ABC transporter ATP-binding protein [Eubacteriales bacterium]
NILIADEPTTALDVTIQAQILRLIGDLRKKLGTAIILITHDLGIVAQTAENVLVMYGGQAVEYSDVKSIYKQPLHPYTVGLLKSIPKLHDQQKRLYNIKGSIPSPKEFPEGCRFSPRCEECMEICRTKKPELVSLPDGRRVRCWKYALNQEKATAKEAAEE